MLPSSVEISIDFSRNLGPRIMQAGLTLSFERSAAFSFTSNADWPPKVAFEHAARAAALAACSF